MKFNDTKLSVLSDEGSTTCTQLFHELMESSSNLQEATELELLESGLVMQKQMLLNA